MQSFRSFAIAAVAAILTTPGAEALTLAQGAQPAETPPSSYRADVYIDSRGCAYVRAGIDGRTSWVPRVTRDRKVVCGMAPTFARGTVAPTQAPTPTPASPSAPEPAPARIARSSMPATAPAADPTAPAEELRDTPAADSVRTVYVACANPGDEMLVPAGRVRIRYTCTAREQVVRKVRLSDGATLRIIATRGPRETVRNRPRAAQAAPVAAPVDGQAVPEGYRVAWDDDRLNPNRGPRSAAGDAQMARVWDDSVPMRRVAGAAIASTTYSTMSAPRRGAEAGGDARFVQAASFADAGNAQRTARRIARLGLPVRMIRVTRGGRALRLVQAGPFASRAEMNRALGEVRGLGFADAFAVK
ncbi:SPOR domain-containing protein [Aliiroseovarius sp.]|uniref:SPOR domain-containing protein n=1 Tax=Aliiroseovarius sp. TaxID=1872442 RepID=UPI002601F9C9|nr:SPOR domain-containing protein [Aliiroseovarius sp.]